MLFTELIFLPFFFLVFAAHWLIPADHWRKRWLLLASYAFYAVWDWRFLILIFISTAVDFFAGAIMSRLSEKKWRRICLLASVGMNLTILGFFKYFDFFLSSVSGGLHLLGVDVGTRTLEIILPVGISFFTFQSMSYTIDIYRQKIPAIASFTDFALYVSFFPQLVAGPIVRAADFLPQLSQRRDLNTVRFRHFFLLFFIGFVKKAFLADSVAPFVDVVFEDPASYTVISVWIAVLLYAVQIYCDFSGYTDMAIAVAGMLGYELRANFNFPYLASSVTDFWRRWHISLSTWLKDYLYIPLGGSRGSLRITYRNLLITMLLGGLWHGAAWTFVCWGALHGLALTAHKEWQRRGWNQSFVGRIVCKCGLIITLYWICITWIFFRATDFGEAWHLFQSFVFLTSNGEKVIAVELLYVVLFAGLAHWAGYRYGQRLEAGVQRLPEQAFAGAYGVAWVVTLLFLPLHYKPFIYFQF